MFYSSTAMGFFDPAIHAAIPADAVEITAADHAALMAAQAEGLVIVADVDGRPVAMAPPPPSVDVLLSALRIERDNRLAAATAILDRHRNQRDFGLPTTLTDAEAIAWARYAQDLRDLPEQTADPANPVWPVAPVP